MNDGTEKPIAFASRTMSTAEKKYSQLDKEGLAMVVKKFHQFLYGRHFTIYTDHKPLLGIFRAGRAIPQMASSRIQRWALAMSTYEYDLLYRPGKENGNADALSRLPLKTVSSQTPIPQEVVKLMGQLSRSPVDATKIKHWTIRDPVLAQVEKFTLHGRPASVEDEIIKSYFSSRQGLSIQAGCLLWGSRVVIPPQVLSILHEMHLRVSRMKSLARGYVWWPGMDKEIEERRRSCLTCQLQQKAPQTVPLHPWEWPYRPWFRLHTDYTGPFMGKTFFIDNRCPFQMAGYPYHQFVQWPDND